MRWYEYKMEVEDLHASDDLKAKLLAMQASAAAPAPESKAEPVQKAVEKPKRPIRFPAKRWAQLAACVALCGVCVYAAVQARQESGAALLGGVSKSAVNDTAPQAANYSLADAGTSVYSTADNGVAAYGARSAGTSGDSALLTSGEAETENASGTAAEAKIIYTADLTLETMEFDAARTALDNALADADGYLESSSEYTTAENSRTLSLTLRVPQDNYQSFLSAVAQAGNVVSQSQQAEDVTNQYLDLEARLSNLTAQRTRLQELQAQAETLSDLLEIESSLSDVQYQIESYQSQLDWYSRQVECCTIYVTLDEVESLTPTDHGFGTRLADALKNGWSGFVSGVQTAVVFLFGYWPAILIGAVGGVIFYRVRRPKKKK